MVEGTEVVRVSLRSDEGAINERGIIRRTYRDEAGHAAGYYVEWEKTGTQPRRMGYVAPVRIVSFEQWREKQGKAAA